MSAHLPGSSPEAKAAPAAGTVYFPCTACGKKLKSPAARAGSKVRCPHCSAVMAVPHGAPVAVPAPLLPAWAILGVLLAASFLFKLDNLDHTALTHWDEVFHAVVAQNVSKHPLRPTLIDVPYLAYDPAVWRANHVWLHKPILSFWQVALSFAVLGVSPFSLRLPAAILSTAAAGLTYLIGKELFDRPTALVAAALQAVSPFLMTLIHGYQFADNIDVALLFWVEAGVFFLVRALRTGSLTMMLLAGVAQGLAYLTKSYLAAIVFGIALTAWLLPLARLARRDDCRIGLAHLMVLLGATILTVLPWTAYCMVEYPVEFWHEHTQVWKHLVTDVEHWAAPWDRLVFDYLVAICGVFYTPVLVAAVILAGKALVQKHSGFWLVYAWGLGVILPHLVAVTKTPSATVIALPALLLLLGHLVTSAGRGERWPLAALSAVLVLCLLVPPVIRNPGHGFPPSRELGAVMRQALWVVIHVAGALAGAAVLVLAGRVTRPLRARAGEALRFYLSASARAFCLLVLLWLLVLNVQAAWMVTSRDLSDPASVAIGAFARQQLPASAVLLCEEHQEDDHLAITFYADRTCYPQQGRALDSLARPILQAGGIPYVVSYRSLPLPRVFVHGTHGPSIYQWVEP